MRIQKKVNLLSTTSSPSSSSSSRHQRWCAVSETMSDDDRTYGGVSGEYSAYHRNIRRWTYGTRDGDDDNNGRGMVIPSPPSNSSNRHQNNTTTNVDDDSTALSPIKRLPSLLSSPLFGGTKVPSGYWQKREATIAQRANYEDDDMEEGRCHNDDISMMIAPCEEDDSQRCTAVMVDSPSHQNGPNSDQFRQNMKKNESMPSLMTFTAHQGGKNNTEDNHENLDDDVGGGNTTTPTTTTDLAVASAKAKQESKQIPLDSSVYEDMLVQAVSWTEDLQELIIRIEDTRVRTSERSILTCFGLPCGSKSAKHSALVGSHVANLRLLIIFLSDCRRFEMQSF
jgi:hypothetical protein